MTKIRCIAVNGNYEPSLWERAIYAHRDWIESRVRRIHEPVNVRNSTVTYTVPMLMGISYTELLIRAEEHLKTRLATKFWDDPIL